MSRVQPVNVRSNWGWILKSPEQVQSFTYHICALGHIRWGLRLGRTCSGPGLHSWTWMDLRRKWTHITNHSGWSKSSHGGMVSWFQIRYSKLHFLLLCFKLQSRSWCIPLYEKTKLVDHRSVPTRRQPELITSYQLIQGHLKTWLAGHMQAD